MSTRRKPFAENAASALEVIGASGPLDKLASWTAARVQSVIERAPDARDLLSGSSLGHPLHPALTDLPIGCWTGAFLLDLTGQGRGAGRRLVGLGVILALPTAAAGWVDWSSTEGVVQRVGLVHALGGSVAIWSFAGSWWQRHRGRQGRCLGLVGLGALALSGWLGGHLAYAMGVGVDTNAFDVGPDDWTSTVPDEPTGPVSRLSAEGNGIAVASTLTATFALGDRCSHRGGPLSQGVVVGECIECPWHGSRFDLRSGAVRRGPASIPQPTYEIREAVRGTEVRRRRIARRGAEH